jgi:thiol:disulfide interchange protein DsbC
MRKFLPIAFAACLSLANGAIAADVKPDPRALLVKKLPPGTSIEDLRPTPIAGLYEFLQGADVNYITADGKYYFDGSFYDMDTHENITENRRVELRLKLMAAVPESQMIVFSPAKSTKYTINVFTDVDCGYCRKLHSEIKALNEMGVKVRYLAFPRSGPDTESWYKAQAVWCSADRNDALTRAKAGAVFDLSKLCKDSPVAREYKLGEDIGVHGTPAIVTEQGDLIGGYLPPETLVKHLDELKLAKR